MKIRNKIPKTLKSACEKSGIVAEVWDEGYLAGNPNCDYAHDYWIELVDGYEIDEQSGWCDDTARKVINALKRAKKTTLSR